MGIEQSLENQNSKYSREYGYFELKTSTNNKIKTALKIYNLTSKEEEKSFQNLIAMYSSYSVPTILPILNKKPLSKFVAGQENLGFCWELEFKFLEINLEEEIIQKKENKDFYSEEEIMKMIDCVLSGLMAFRLNKLVHGNVNCSTILIDNNPILEEDELVEGNETNSKIYCVGLPLLLNNFDVEQIIRKKEYAKLFLSPQNLYELKREPNLKPNASEKNDVFSLGITALKMALLASNPECNLIEEVYDFQNMTIRKNVLERKIYECKNFYSAGFSKLIGKMVEYEMSNRLDFEGVMNHFSLITQENEEEHERSNKKNDGYLTNREESNIFETLQMQDRNNDFDNNNSILLNQSTKKEMITFKQKNHKKLQLSKSIREQKSNQSNEYHDTSPHHESRNHNVLSFNPSFNHSLNPSYYHSQQESRMSPAKEFVMESPKSKLSLMSNKKKDPTPKEKHQLSSESPEKMLRDEIQKYLWVESEELLKGEQASRKCMKSWKKIKERFENKLLKVERSSLFI